MKKAFNRNNVFWVLLSIGVVVILGIADYLSMNNVYHCGRLENCATAGILILLTVTLFLSLILIILAISDHKHIHKDEMSISLHSYKSVFRSVIVLFLVGTLMLLFNKIERYFESRSAHAMACASQNKETILQKVGRVDKTMQGLRLVEKDIPGIPSEGTNVRTYYDQSNRLSVVEIRSFGAVVRHLSRFYVEHNAVYFIDAVTDEWNLEKLYGKNAELSSSQGEYVVATSTLERYIIAGNRLCTYIADTPRTASYAVAKSNPSEDVKELLRMYDEVLKK